MYSLYDRITYIFDPLHKFWEHEKMHRKISVALVFLFLGNLLLIELNRRHLLPVQLGSLIHESHFYAIQTAFTVILILEIISLIFILPCSFSKSVGMQFEILALILMRNSFKELAYFPEPITYSGNEEIILHILSDGFGALLIFALLGVYYRLQKHEEKEAGKGEDLYGFVAAKKGISLILLGSFIFMGGVKVYQNISGVPAAPFFHDFYTLLILTDILIVLVAQCFHPAANAMFRNSGYALATMIIRIALVAPVYYNVALGVSAVLFAISLTLISSKLFPQEV